MMNFTVDQEKCIQCGECITDCPYGVLELKDEYPVVVQEKKEKCIKCQHCFAICKPGAITIFDKDPADSKTLQGNLPSAEQMECLIKGRRSVRRYKDESLAPETIRQLLDVVANCPTGRNNRQLLFTVIDNKEMMQKVREATMEGIREALITDNIPSGLEFFDSLLQAWDDGHDIVFRGAPHMLITSSPADSPSPMQDTIIALSYFELYAQSMGLGTLWNGLATWAINSLVLDMKERLGIPESHIIGYTMSFGKPAVKYHRTVQRGEPTINRVVWSDTTEP